MSLSNFLMICCICFLTTGCVAIPIKPYDPDKPAPAEKKKDDESKSDKKDDDKKDDDKKKAEENKPAKTLFSWAIAKPSKEDDDEPKEPKKMPHDRPHFTDSSTTVGYGRTLIETGYTYSRDANNGTTTTSHSVPETLVRMGLFAEWFEARIFWNDRSERTANNSFSSTNKGAEDVVIGTRLAMTEQHNWLPETAIQFRTTVPTGSDAFGDNRMLPGIVYHYSWELIKDKLTLEGQTQGDAARDPCGRIYTAYASSFALEYDITSKMELFAEVYGILPFVSSSPSVGSQYYFNGGFTYFITPDFTIDVRVGVGLNPRADDFFTGTGICIWF
jgi:hypothetical protein